MRTPHWIRDILKVYRVELGRNAMNRSIVFALALIIPFALSQSSALAQNQGFEKKTYNYSEWTKGRLPKR
jgi:hypothetical protein